MVLACAANLCAEPVIKNLSLRGIRTGGTTTIAIDGDGLSPEATMMLGVPIAQQSVKPGATATRIEVELTIAESTAPGVYPLRLLTPDGVSASVPVGVDPLPQLPISSRVDELPVALSGVISGDQSAKVAFPGRKGESIVVEIESRRLLAELNPVLHLYDARGVQIQWAQGSKRLGGDARLTATLPADGDYSVEVHDALYQGRAPGHFRLKIGKFHFADAAFPSAVKAGGKANIVYVGTNLSSEARTVVDAPTRSTFFAAPLPPDAIFSGCRPAVFSSPWDEAVEQTSASGDLQTIHVPSGVHGRLIARAEDDRYRVAASAGEKLRFDIHSRRLGSPLDGVLTVYDASGKNVLTVNDDRPALADPGLDVTVPAGANEIIVGVKDLLSRGGDDFVYRLTVVPQDRPDFSLSISDDRLNVPRGGRALLRVGVDRRGYGGPIDLSLEELPSGIAVENAHIPAGGKLGLVVLSGVGETNASAITRVVGRALDMGPSPDEVLRTALLPADALTERQPWLREEVAMALTNPAPITLAWAPSASSLPLGSKVATTVKATRAANTAGAIRLSLVTNQETPRKTIKENNQDKQVDDVDRTLRLEGAPVIPAESTETTASILVPADLADMPYAMVLRGELLSGDGKQVLATTYSQVLSAQPARPVALDLTGGASIDARAGLGETGKFTGRIVRQPNFSHPVRVMIAGLPGGIPSPFEDLPADKSEFDLSVRLPHGMKTGALSGVQLVAVSLASPGDLQNAVRTNSVPVTINVVAGEKPPSEPPLRIFEDEEAFAMALDQGGGQIRLDGGEKYSGNSSVRVTPDQRFNPALPGLGIKIRKEPGPGEYRYLRFAWKKQGGNQICLQLNHDGQWGPTAGGTGAKFRYHAGPGDCFGASLRVADRAPNRMTVVTRDLYADFGEFTFTGLALSAIDGQGALFDHIYLGRTVDDLDTVKPQR
jgi:hypothetical protein